MTAKASTPAKRKTVSKKAAAAPVKKTRATKSSGSASATKLIDQRIRDIGGWKGATLQRMRGLILDAAPGVIEEVKWRKPSNSMAGVPVWSSHGILCTG